MIQGTPLIDSHSIDISTVDLEWNSSRKAKRRSTTFCDLLRCLSPISLVFNFCTTALCVYIYERMPVITEGPKFEAFTDKTNQNRTSFDSVEFGDKMEAYDYPGHVHQWLVEEPKYKRFSEPVPGSFCIKILENGMYRIYSKITLKYTNCTTIYHGLAHRKINGSAVLLENNNFQWNPPQTGRTPSTIQTINPIKALKGDKFCIQTNKTTDIYQSTTNNKLVVTKVG